MDGEFVNRQNVTTPNGAGVVQGNCDNRVMVRHICKDMISTGAGECFTPNAVYSTLYLYEPAELKPGGKR